MDELIDILDETGNFTGTTALKSQAHHLGLFHATVHIWLFTDDGQLLLQQRGKNKNTYPLLWDVSVAGHVGASESITTSALREIKEEIGLLISWQDIVKIGVFKSIQKHRQDLIDCEFHHTFLCKLEVSISKLKKQKREVEDLKLIEIGDFHKALNDVEESKKYVPHSLSYYQEVLQKIEGLLKK